MDVSRRGFLTVGGASLALSAAGSRLHADPLGMPMGFQIYGVREQASKDLTGTLRRVAAMGYARVELCSFPAYAKSGFGPLADMKPPEIRRAIDNAGMRAESCHFHYDQFLDSTIQETIAYAHGLGLKFMVISSPRPSAGLDEWKWNFDLFNRAGRSVKEAGMQLAYHNHANEWKKVGNVLVFDQMLRDLDPQFVQLQMDLGGVVSSGYDPVPYLANNPGRFCSLHVKDGRPSGGGSSVVGAGVIDWKALFRAARQAGIQNYFVEMEVRPPEDPFQALEASYAYLHRLEV